MISVYCGLSTLKDLHQNVENLHGPTFEKVLPGKLGGSDRLSNSIKKITNEITKIAKNVQIGPFYKKTVLRTIGVIYTKNFQI